MMDNTYIIRRIESPGEAKQLQDFFNEIFHPEKVGEFAYTLFRHFPGMKKENWYVACEKETGQIVSAFALIPWTWEFEGVTLKVGEMGIVGTHKDHRKKGLMNLLEAEFSTTLEQEKYDLSVIQGIPGFYHRFGYYYAVPLENHINLPLYLVRDTEEEEPYTFRPGETKDIAYFLDQDRLYRSVYSLGCVRSELCWEYMLIKSKETIYGSEIWIMEQEKTEERFYFRIPGHGFGTGLIVSECSEDISPEAMKSLLRFCKKKAREKNKPYIRLNIHNKTPLGNMARYLGAKENSPYAWQIKIPDIPRFLTTMRPVLEKRIRNSCFKHFTGTLRFDFYTSSIDCTWDKGSLKTITPAQGRCELQFHIPTDLVPPLFLGHSTRKELRKNRPDISAHPVQSIMLMDILFPGVMSWIHEQY